MPRRALFRLAVIAFACLAAAGPAAAKTTWLCLPGQKDSACTSSLTTTLYSPANKQLRTATPKADRRKAFDCFYVYPTVSDQKTLERDQRPTRAARDRPFQAARFGQHCRVYAPVYRQLTLAGHRRRRRPARPRARAARLRRRPRHAWKDYLRSYNRGRGVVLVGHSQGAGMLSELVRSQIDDARRPCASAWSPPTCWAAT